MKNINLMNIKQQQGAVLIMSLLMLFVLTLIGVSSINTTTMEEKMSGNTRNRMLAFQAAESALVEARRTITSFAGSVESTANTSGSAGYYKTGYGPTVKDALDKTWWTANNKIQASANGDVKSKSQYVIEYIKRDTQLSDLTIRNNNEQAPSPPPSLFKITVRGTGLTDSAVVVIQQYTLGNL